MTKQILDEGNELLRQIETLEAWRKSIESAGALAFGPGNHNTPSVSHSTSIVSLCPGESKALIFNFSGFGPREDAPDTGNDSNILEVAKAVALAEIDKLLKKRRTSFDMLGTAAQAPAAA